MTPAAQESSETKPVSLPTARPEPLDPAPELHELRERQPLCRLRYPDDHLGWLVTSYSLAREVLLDSRFGIAPPRRRPTGDPRAEAEHQQQIAELPEHSGVLINLDPPQHTRVRRALARHFTVRRISDHRPAIEQIVEGRLDLLEQAERPADLVEIFSLPMSSLAICELLGAPSEDREIFELPTAVIGDPDASGAEKIKAEQDFFAYCRELIAQKREEPGSDLLSELILEGELSETEIVGVAFLLLEAGHVTTSSMLAISVFTLLSQPHLWDGLKADPDKIGPAVEELLRFLTIIQIGPVTRTALEEADIAGVPVKAGESVTVSLAAANRDPNKFAQPDALDFSRDARGHVAFGHGRHMCIGQHLARLEMTVALASLIERFPSLRLAAPADEVRFGTGTAFIYSLPSLPVTWEAGR